MNTKIYTKVGDSGQTSIIGKDRVSKSDLRLAAYGTVDELNATLGLCVTNLKAAAVSILDLRSVHELLTQFQNDLFAIGSQLACADNSMKEKMPKVRVSSVYDMEVHIDKMSSELPELREFILPGGHLSAALLHIARTVCRRAERAVVEFQAELQVDFQADHHLIQYLNRLGDYLFVAARYCNFKSNTTETKWQK